MQMLLSEPRNKDMLILEDEMKAVAGNLYVCTDDGCLRTSREWLPHAIEELVRRRQQQYDVCVAIGPMIMMKFVCLLTKEA